jgi:hypothetical protein
MSGRVAAMVGWSAIRPGSDKFPAPMKSAISLAHGPTYRAEVWVSSRGNLWFERLCAEGSEIGTDLVDSISPGC